MEADQKCIDMEDQANLELEAMSKDSKVAHYSLGGKIEPNNSNS